MGDRHVGEGRQQAQEPTRLGQLACIEKIKGEFPSAPDQPARFFLGQLLTWSWEHRAKLPGLDRILVLPVGTDEIGVSECCRDRGRLG